MVYRTDGGRTEPIREHPQGPPERYLRQWGQKGGKQTGKEATETGSWRRDAGAKREMGRRSRISI